MKTDRRWICFYITYFGTFTTFMQMSIYWTSLWPYITEIDPTTPNIFFGLIVSSYSLGTVVAAPCYGWWSSRTKTTRWPLITGFIISLIGNVFMAFIETIPVPVYRRRYVMLIARFVWGLGGGNNGVAQAFLAHATTEEERSTVLGYQSAAMASMMLLGPGFSAALSPLGYPGWVVGPLHFNMYTSAAWLCIVLTVICLLLYVFVYREFDVSSEKDGKGIDVKQGHVVSYGSMHHTHASENDETKLLKDDPDSETAVNVRAVLCCVAVRFISHFCAAYDDTIASPFTMVMFNWSRREAILYTGILMGCSGIISLFSDAFVGAYVLKRVKERIVIIFGLSFLFVYYIISYPWPGLPPLINDSFPSNWTTSNIGLNSTTELNVYPMVLAQNETNCDSDFYPWCSYTTRVALPAYIVAYIFVCLSCTSVCVPNSTLYSKVLGSQHQGFLQSLFSAVANLAAMVSPLIVGALFQTYGPRTLWDIAMVALAVCLALIAANFKTLVPDSGPNCGDKPKKCGGCG